MSRCPGKHAADSSSTGPSLNSRLPLTRQLEYHPSGVSKEEYSQSCRVPFTTDRYTTTNIYTRFKNLSIRPPKHFDMTFIRRLGIWDRLKEYLDVLRLTRFFTSQWEGHDLLCLEMCSSSREGHREDGEQVMHCTFRGELCEISKDTMHEAFGFHSSRDIPDRAPATVNYNSAWIELTGCNNFTMSGTSCALLEMMLC